MKQIPLTQGKFTLVDDEDYDYLMQWKWHAYHHPNKNDYYAIRACCKDKVQKIIRLHRIIMDCPNDMIVDHIDHNGLNNQKSNLRICTYSQNQKNTTRRGTSKYLGVCWHTTKITRKTKNGIKIYKSSKWKAAIKANGKYIFLGRYDNEEDAALAYNEAAKKYHKEFANINVI